MVGNNILHFKIVRTAVQPNISEESRSTLSAFTCSLCGKMFQNRGALEMHMSSAHCSVKDYRCDTCNARFTSKVGLVSHMHYHTGPRPYTCTVCTKSFCRSNSLDLHMKMHVTGHRHFCQICGRWFKSLASLGEHENTCLAILNGSFINCDRPFRWKCSYCEKMFHHRRDRVGYFTGLSII
ncbi:zinc finger, C2H2 type [Dictyocaulus viviparus]|uniref:Zinc finger, C2H2 type n=1 Tax=Dictyocaulus viviparus TaxID=29172 RepID=A0A0D8Y264_DICVI|nr:zinc finger, C2H2 type [Dictyocaulus viviparus]